MQDEERRSLLMTGMSLGELLLVFLLIGLMLTEATRSMQGGLQRIAMTEAFGLVTAEKMHWVELWANDGVRAPDDTAPFASTTKGKYVEAIGTGSVDGTANFRMTAAMGPEDEVLTFRPAFPAGSHHIVTWVCGLAPAPVGFIAQGENRTTLTPAQLLSTCRAPAT